MHLTKISRFLRHQKCLMNEVNPIIFNLLLGSIIKKPTYEADIYSFGMVLFFVF
jgi:hypothetical protein